LLIIANFPLHAQNFMDRGFAAYQAGNTKEAIRWFDWAIAADTTNADRYFTRGRVKREVKNTSEAVLDFKKALELNPKNGDIHFFLALAQFENNNFDRAAKSNTKAIELLTSYTSQVYLNRAQCYTRVGKYKLAIQDLDSVIVLKDNNLATAYRDRGQVKLNISDKKGALEDFKKLAEITPKDAQLKWDIGQLSYTIEAYEDALAYYSKAMEMSKDNGAQLYMVRGETFEKLKLYEGAITDYSMAIELNNQQPNAYYSRGQANARMGNMKAACSDWTRASELGHIEAKNVIVYNCEK